MAIALHLKDHDMVFAHLGLLACLLRAGLTLQPPRGSARLPAPCSASSASTVCHHLWDHSGWNWLVWSRWMSRQSHSSICGSSGTQQWVRDMKQSPLFGFGQCWLPDIHPTTAPLHVFSLWASYICLPHCSELLFSALPKSTAEKIFLNMLLLSAWFCWASSLSPAPV